MRADPTLRTYSTADLCALIPRLTARQLQWWDEHRVVMPRHYRHRRIYQFNEAIAIAVIADLRRKGLALQRIREVVRRLQREIGSLQHHVAMGGQSYIVVAGKSVIIETSPDRLADTLSASTQRLFVVDVRSQVQLLVSEPNIKAFRHAV